MTSNMKPKAIYARQSKDRKESLSIDAQIAQCKKFLNPDEPFEIFIDRGISAKNTDRPQFQKLLEKVKTGAFSAVIVYKLDRFSRNTVDFMTIHEIFEKHAVKFISCNESFNTSTPMGKAMLAITAVFAQMERETIAERCRDTYYQRAEQGLCTGGRVHFGFIKTPAMLNGVKTSKLEAEPQQAEIVKRVYDYYTEDMMSVSDILVILNSEKPRKLFTRDGVKYMLRNGVYVKANANVYDYLKTTGAIIKSDLSDFNGTRGFFTYSDPQKRKTKKLDTFRDENIIIGLHDGIIDSETWLKSQMRLDGRKSYRRTGTSLYTWLSGLTVCGYCNHALTFSRGGSKNSPRYYATCGGRKDKYCLQRQKRIRADELEIIVEKEILNYLNTLPKLRVKTKSKEQQEIKTLETKLLNLKLREQEITGIAKEYAQNNLLNLLRTLDTELNEIKAEKKNLQDEIQALEHLLESRDISEKEIKNYAQRFSDADIETKKKIAALFIEKIVSTDDSLEVHYKI